MLFTCGSQVPVIWGGNWETGSHLIAHQVAQVAGHVKYGTILKSRKHFYRLYRYTSNIFKNTKYRMVITSGEENKGRERDTQELQLFV
jgi:hypothetical protein